MNAARALAVLLAVLSLSGCIVGDADLDAEFDVVAWDLRPLEFEPQAELKIGSGLIGLAGTAARWSDDRDAAIAADLLAGVEAVHVGSYTLHGRRRDAPRDLTLAAREEFEDLGWTFVVRTRERGDEAAWVMVRPDRDRLQMLVVALEHDEMNLVRIDGHPEQLLQAAIRRDEDFAVAARSVGDEF